MRVLIAGLPAAACAAAMFLCFRMMRHPDMTADGGELDTLRKEVADLREELARAGSVPSGPGGDDARHLERGEPSETATDARPLDARTAIGARTADSRPHE